MNEILEPLLLDLSSLSDQEAEDLAFDEYNNLYLDHDTHNDRVGSLLAHDNDKVVFFESRFEHAFFTSLHKTTRQYNKDKFHRDRAERVRWIGPVIKGDIGNADWYSYPDRNRRDSNGRIIIQRLYVLWEECYMVWLEPRKNDNEWKFSTAYTAPRGYIRGKVRGLVRKKISRD